MFGAADRDATSQSDCCEWQCDAVRGAGDLFISVVSRFRRHKHSIARANERKPYADRSHTNGIVLCGGLQFVRSGHESDRNSYCRGVLGEHVNYTESNDFPWTIAYLERHGDGRRHTALSVVSRKCKRYVDTGGLGQHDIFDRRLDRYNCILDTNHEFVRHACFELHRSPDDRATSASVVPCDRIDRHSADYMASEFELADLDGRGPLSSLPPHRWERIFALARTRNRH